MMKVNEWGGRRLTPSSWRAPLSVLRPAFDLPKELRCLCGKDRKEIGGNEPILFWAGEGCKEGVRTSNFTGRKPSRRSGRPCTIGRFEGT